MNRGKGGKGGKACKGKEGGDNFKNENGFPTSTPPSNCHFILPSPSYSHPTLIRDVHPSITPPIAIKHVEFRKS